MTYIDEILTHFSAEDVLMKKILLSLYGGLILGLATQTLLADETPVALYRCLNS